jgi:hypothetical protein
MAPLTQVGYLLPFELRVDAAVRCVADTAILVNRLVFPHKRPSLLRMTFVAELINARCLDLGGTHGAVGLMAVRAGDPSLYNRVVRPPVNLGLYILVTLAAGLIFGAGRIAQTDLGRAIARLGLGSPVDRMAVTAGHILLLMDAGIPQGKLGAVFMAAQAYGCLLLSRLTFAESDQASDSAAPLPHVFTARAVTTLATLI